MNYIFNSLIDGFIFTGDLKKDAHNFLIKHNRFRIAEHSLRVAEKSKILAKQYGVDEKLADAAGLLHDIGGVYANEKRVDITKALGITVLPEEDKLPLILHQKISKVMAQQIFNIHSNDVLNAIGCHTTLKANASLLDMILFVADKIEWDQEGLPPYIEELEKSTSISIEFAAFTYIKHQWDNRENLKVIHPWLEEAYKDLEKSLCEGQHFRNAPS